MTTTIQGYAVQSSNFSWHEPVPASSYADAIAKAKAKARGWDARIEYGGRLVATWSALYGVHVYDRARTS